VLEKMGAAGVADLLVCATNLIDYLRVDGIERGLARNNGNLEAIVLQTKRSIVAALRGEDFEIVQEIRHEMQGYRKRSKHIYIV